MEEALPHARSGANKALTPCEAVTVKTTARLHFGFLDPSGRGPNPFGSFGLALDRPQTRLTLSRGEDWRVEGPEAERAERYLRTLAATAGLETPYQLGIDTVITPHAGLGSGTQLALAVGTAFARLEGVALSPAEIATLLGRGARSGIGIGTFTDGGLVLDAGPQGGALPPIRARLSFPDDWRVVLVFDESRAGLSGLDEVSAFATLPEFPARATAALAGRVDTALASVETGDFDGFAAEVGALQAAMGEYFGPLQGGPFVSPGIASIMGRLRAAGVKGIGQSSWGPTGFAFAPSQAEAVALLDAIGADGAHAGLRFEIAQGRNSGAEIGTH
jgi:beta-ribofuranosylaminobenzene 5'-phosphate synthase